MKRASQITSVFFLALAVSGMGGCAGARSGQRATMTASTPAAQPSLAAAEPAPAAEEIIPETVAPEAKAERPKLPVRRVAPKRAPAQTQDALALEDALRKFMAVRSVRPRKKQAEMPPEVQRRWHWMMDEVEMALDAGSEDATTEDELGLFIRTRVALDAELDMDRRRYKDVPVELKDRHKSVLAAVSDRVWELRQVSTAFVLQDKLPRVAQVELSFPVQVVHVTSYYGRRRDPILRKQTRLHAGVDLSGGEGALISAAGPGVVAFADWQGGGGNHVIVVHPNGYRTHYSHMSKILVEAGTSVDTGTPLGLMGSTGRSTGPHLHFAVSRNGAFMDPLDALGVPLTAEGPAVPRS